MPTIYERVKDIVVDKLGVGEDDVAESASFVEDLNADSLDLVELIMAFEEEFSHRRKPAGDPRRRRWQHRHRRRRGELSEGPRHRRRLSRPFPKVPPSPHAGRKLRWGVYAGGS